MQPSPQPAEFAVIFDMDGVLIDSVPTLVPSYNAILSRHGCAITFEEFRRYNGWRLADIVIAFNRRYGIALVEQEFREEVNRIQGELLAQARRDYSPEHKLVSELRAHGVRIAVATASSRNRAERFLQICGYGAFDAFVTGEDVTAGKPSPDIFLEAARRLGTDPSRCVVCEDALNGLEAARRAGMRRIAIAGSDERAALGQNADLVVDRLGDLTYEDFREILSAAPSARND